MTQDTKNLANSILLTLYDCTARYDHDYWDLESAFRAKKLDPDPEVVDDVYANLVDRGLIVSKSDPEIVKMIEGDVETQIISFTGVKLTPRGISEAVALLDAKEPKTFSQKVHAMNWATWGGMAAIAAAAASVAAAIFSYKALN